MSVTMITGADGHVGRSLARWLLDNTDDELLLHVRAGNEAQCDIKRVALGGLANNARCRVVGSDLRRNKPFENISRAGVRSIVHCAAVTDFGVSRERAREVNVEGTARLVEFAASCPNLERLVFLSSLYAAGLRDGVLSEGPFQKPDRFANHYEWSKWRCEAMLQAREDVPWQVHRVATLLADNECGAVRQQNVIHNTLRLFYYGLLSVLPGVPDTRVYMTTTSIAVDTIGRLMRSGADHAYYNISDNSDSALSLGEFCDKAYDAFMRSPAFARHGILKPRFCDQASFDTLVSSVDQFGGTLAQALTSVKPFAPQLFSDKRVDNSVAAAVMPEFDGPAIVERVCEQLVADGWNSRRRQESRRCA